MFVVYWIDISGTHPKPGCMTFEQNQMTQALKYSEDLRQQNRTERKYAFITMTSEQTDLVGEMGVASVGDDMKLPDGHEYNWRKRRP